MYCSMNKWVYFQKKSNSFIQKRRVGLFLRVGLFSGDYGTKGEGLGDLNTCDDVMQELMSATKERQTTIA